MGRTVLATVTRQLVDASVGVGLSRPALLSSAGLDERQLSNADARVSLRSHMAVWAALIRAGGERDLGLELGRSVHVGMLGVLGHALGQAATLRDALPFYERCSALVSDLFMPRVLEQDGRLVFEHVSPPEIARLRHPDEMALAAALTLVRSLTEVNWPALAVRFQHAAPASTAGLEAFFRRPAAFGAPSCRLELEGGALSAPIRKAEPRLFDYLVRHAEALAAQLSERASIVESLRRAIAPVLRDGEPPQERVARGFGMSGRTLQRRLKEAGTTFADVVDETRRELALLYLAEPRLSAAEIALLLGYAEPTAFFRAFRRWTGSTPREYRVARACGGAAAPAPPTSQARS